MSQNETTENDQRDAARYRWLAKWHLSQGRGNVSCCGGPWHIERYWVLSFAASDDNDDPLRDVGEFIDEKMQMEKNNAQ